MKMGAFFYKLDFNCFKNCLLSFFFLINAMSYSFTAHSWLRLEGVVKIASWCRSPNMHKLYCWSLNVDSPGLPSV